jgi:hypothetical protein
MIYLQGSVKISTHVMTVLKRNLQAHNRILPVREFVREVKLHDPFMKIGCLDFGTKCIGTAATDETTVHFPRWNDSSKTTSKNSWIIGRLASPTSRV